jgi:hypothetical protein
MKPKIPLKYKKIKPEFNRYFQLFTMFFFVIIKSAREQFCILLNKKIKGEHMCMTLDDPRNGVFIAFRE